MKAISIVLTALFLLLGTAVAGAEEASNDNPRVMERPVGERVMPPRAEAAEVATENQFEPVLMENGRSFAADNLRGNWDCSCSNGRGDCQASFSRGALVCTSAQEGGCSGTCELSVTTTGLAPAIGATSGE